MGKRRKRNKASFSSDHDTTKKVKTKPTERAPTPRIGKTDTSNNNNTLPPPFPSHLPRPSAGYLTQDNHADSFQQALRTCYNGFIMEHDAIDFEADLVQELQASMVLFRRDITQPLGLGTPCAATKVTRCLLGEPGTTYKYLGLRMFSYAWNNDTPHLNRLRKVVTERTNHHLQADNKSFTVCLINCMDPPSTKNSWKKDTTDPAYSTAVSWHADSSLEHYSTIAVYQTMTNNNESNWSIGLRVAPHAEGPGSGKQQQPRDQVTAPPLAVALPSNSCYYMLDNFNHHHQHAVLLGNNSSTTPQPQKNRRYSCTFRLLRPNHTIQELLDRCRRCQFHKKGTRIFRSEQLLLYEIESEWLRQYYIQGPRAADTTLWHSWIQELWGYWSQLEHRTSSCIALLRRAAQYNNTHTPVSRKEREKQQKAHQALETIRKRESASPTQLYNVLADALEERALMRQQWAEREQDRVFAQRLLGYQPLPFLAAFHVKDPTCPRSSPLPLDTQPLAHALRNGSWPDDEILHFSSCNNNWTGEWALEVQQPWSNAILDGSKSIETRLYTLPEALLGRRLYILESAAGEAGVSGLGDSVTLSTTSSSSARLTGWIQVSAVIRYESADDFQKDEPKHRVDPSSGYGWKEDCTCIFGWVVEEYHRCDDTALYFSATRRKRSLFELQRAKYEH